MAVKPLSERNKVKKQQEIRGCTKFGNSKPVQLSDLDIQISRTIKPPCHSLVLLQCPGTGSITMSRRTLGSNSLTASLLKAFASHFSLAWKLHGSWTEGIQPRNTWRVARCNPLFDYFDWMVTVFKRETNKQKKTSLPSNAAWVSCASGDICRTSPFLAVGATIGVLGNWEGRQSLCRWSPQGWR